MCLRCASTVGVVLLAAGLPRVARAGAAAPAVRASGDDTTVIVGPDGSAAVRHDVHFKVLRGPIDWVDYADIDPDATLDPAVHVSTDEGTQITAHAVRQGERVVRVVFDDGRVARGAFRVELGWRLDLVGSRRLSPDASSFRLLWTAPPAREGMDSVRTIFDFPAAPEAPRSIVPGTGAPDDVALATVRRAPDRDVLELVRPHVSRGEAPIWAVRVDARALALLPRPSAPVEVAAAPAPGPRWADFVFALAAAAAGVAFAVAVARKDRRFRAACAERGARPSGLLPLPGEARAAIAGAGLAAALVLEGTVQPTAGGACLALAILAACARAPRSRTCVRGPGRWQEIPPEEAFVRPALRADRWDLATPTGRRFAAAVLALVFAVGLLVARIDGAWGRLAVLDAAALVPLFVTGGVWHLPPDGASSAAGWFAPLFRLLRTRPALRVVPWARRALDRQVWDELRLLVHPLAPLPGLVGVEVGLAWTGAPTGWMASPQVLVRVLDGSPAATRLACEAPGTVLVAGRRIEERVMQVAPRRPTRSSTAALVAHLSTILADRRVAQDAAARVPERRAAVVSAVVCSAAGEAA